MSTRADDGAVVHEETRRQNATGGERGGRRPVKASLTGSEADTEMASPASTPSRRSEQPPASPATPSASVSGSQRVVYEFAKNTCELVRATIGTYRGQRLASIRVWVDGPDDAVVATPKGVNVREEQVPELYEAVKALKAEYDLSRRLPRSVEADQR